MGVDIYLESIFAPFLEAYEKELDLRPPPQINSLDDVYRASNAFFDDYRASGGYFRNGYNSGDVMWAMGLDWLDDVGARLDADSRLPIAQASEVVALIESRPLTREGVASHFLRHMTNGREEHPVTGPIVACANETLGNSEPMLPPEFDQIFAFLNDRRDELLALLRKSIALNEPLVCSL
jgi:hypothetical protein